LGLARPRRAAAGFSLIELLAVVAIMSVLAAVASPRFVLILRDRRVNAAAMKIVNYYRTARMLAVGRGLPILVNWNAAGNLQNSNPGSPGLIQMIEPVLTVAAGGAPVVPPSSCSQVNWTYFPTLTVSAPSNGVQLVDAFDLKNGAYDYTTVSLTASADMAAAPTTQAFADICFSPSGTAWVRFAPNGTFTQLLAVPWFTVTRAAWAAGGSTGLQRTVFVPPNGVARMGL
jgi:type IV fimbrial biogenesis protein FimT